MAALVRHWITLADGLQIDEKQFRKDIDRLIQGATSKGPVAKAH
jgi:hypothetical protein